MKTIFLRNINSNAKRKRKKFILSGALVALILILIIFRDFSFKVLNRPVMYILHPFLNANTEIKKRWQNIRTDFSDKERLQDENVSIRENIIQLETKIAFSEAIEKENVALKTAFSAEERQAFILTYVISRPPSTPYDMLIIDSGSKKGIKEGMQVSAFGNVLLGYVSDVFADMSKIKLISSFGEETNVIFESSGISAIAIGRGGENLEITLPREIQVNAGERIVSLGKRPMLVGIVEKIEMAEADPLQKIIFRLPVNIQYLNQIFILKK